MECESTASNRHDAHLGRNLARQDAPPQVWVVDIFQIEVQRAEAGLVLGRDTAAPAVQLALDRARLDRRRAIRLQGGARHRLNTAADQVRPLCSLDICPGHLSHPGSPPSCSKIQC